MMFRCACCHPKTKDDFEEKNLNPDNGQSDNKASVNQVIRLEGVDGKTSTLESRQAAADDVFKNHDENEFYTNTGTKNSVTTNQNKSIRDDNCGSPIVTDPAISIGRTVAEEEVALSHTGDESSLPTNQNEECTVVSYIDSTKYRDKTDSSYISVESNCDQASLLQESGDVSVSGIDNSIPTTNGSTGKNVPLTRISKSQQFFSHTSVLSESPFSFSRASQLPSSLEQNITVRKGREAMGMTLESVNEGINGCIVREVLAGGAVHNDGRIQVGDYIVSLNMENLRRITTTQCHGVLRRVFLLSNIQIRITYISGKDVVQFFSTNSDQHSSANEDHSSELKLRSPLSSPKHVIESLSPASSQSPSPVLIVPSDLIPTTPTKTDYETTAFNDSSPVNISDLPPTTLLNSQKSNDFAINEPHRANIEVDIVNLTEGANQLSVSTDHSTIDDHPMENDQSNVDLSSQGISRVTSNSDNQKTVLSSPAISDFAWGPSRCIELMREEGKSLGISIVGGRIDMFHISPENVISGIFIKHVLPDSPAGRNGSLKTGDRIIEVNGHSLCDVTHDFAVGVIRNAQNPVRFTVQSLVDVVCPPDIEDESSHLADMNYKPESGDNNDLHFTYTTPDIPNELKEDVKEEVPKKKDDEKCNNDGDDDDDDQDSDASNHSNTSLKRLQREYGDLTGDIHIIELDYSSYRLGLSLAGDKNRGTMSTFIAGIHPQGVAAQDGRILVGDQLLEVNGQSLQSHSHLNSSVVIKSQLTPVIRLVIVRREDALNHMAVKPVIFLPSSLSELSDSSPVHEISPQISQPSSPEMSSLRDVYDTITTVVLNRKHNSSLGLAIQEKNHHGKLGIFVKSLTSGGIAEKEGNLQVNDQILEVNEQSLIGCDYETAIGIFKDADSPVRVTVCKCSTPQTPPNSTFLSVPDSDFHPRTKPDETQDPSKCPILSGAETTIEIEKGRKGLGLSIIGGCDTPLGAVIIHEVYETGSAAEDGRLRQGDQILMVNNEDLQNVPHERVLQCLRQCPSTITMTVLREEMPVKDDMIDTFGIDLIKKPGKGLGISIVGKKTGPGVFISDVVKGGVADSDGRLMHGDQILAVNDSDLRNSSQDEAALILKTSMGKISLMIGRLKALSKCSSHRTTGSSHHTGIQKSNSNASNKAKFKHSKKDESSPQLQEHVT